MTIVIAVELLVVIYLLWAIAYNQQAPFGRRWLPRWWNR